MGFLRFGEVFLSHGLSIYASYPMAFHWPSSTLAAPWQVVLEPQKSIRDNTKEMVSALLGCWGNSLSIGCISSPYGPYMAQYMGVFDGFWDSVHVREM